MWQHVFDATVGPALLGVVGWVYRLGDRVTKIETLHTQMFTDLDKLLDTKFDAADRLMDAKFMPVIQRLDRL